MHFYVCVHLPAELHEWIVNENYKPLLPGAIIDEVRKNDKERFAVIGRYRRTEYLGDPRETTPFVRMVGRHLNRKRSCVVTG
jgi:hypothetical protein